VTTTYIPSISEQTDNVASFGYTPREALFLVNAALHSGYFVMRQLAPKGGTVAHRFNRRLLAFRHATATVCASNARLYHLCGKSLYRALDQEDNRHRRPHTGPQIRAKVMGLDYVLEHPGFRFLPTEEDKVTFFDGLKLPRTVFPTRTYTGKDGETDRYFVDKYPIRIDPATGQVAFCFVDDGAFGEVGFDSWLCQYDALLRALPGSEVVFVSANPSRFGRAKRTFSGHFSTPASGLDPAEKLAYFELRKDIESKGLGGRSQAQMDTWKRLRKTFSDPSFGTQYEAWLGGVAPELERPPVGFSAYHLDHSYAFTAGPVE